MIVSYSLSLSVTDTRLNQRQTASAVSWGVTRIHLSFSSARDIFEACDVSSCPSYEIGSCFEMIDTTHTRHKPPWRLTVNVIKTYWSFLLVIPARQVDSSKSLKVVWQW